MSAGEDTDAPSRSDAPAPDTAAAAASSTRLQPEVLVIGGGPAGSTAAALLAARGRRVLLLEKARHPRFHIGESLLPMNLPILQRLGVLEQVRAIGVHKAGADFPQPGREEHNVFRFSRALAPTFDHAFQVRRADFDALLFAHARQAGADAREDVKVEDIEFGSDGRPSRVRARDAQGATLDIRPQYVIDASGRDTFFGAKLKLKQRNAAHQSAAIFSHYRGVQRFEGENAGNITIARFAHGWLWVIPLPDDVTSVGAVCFPDYLKQRRGDNEGFLERTLQLVPPVWKRMADAQRVAPVHVTGNYAYQCSRMAGPGWVMAGDAYAFVDPIFSSGVFLAMNSAEQAATLADAVLDNPACEAELQRAMDRRLRRGLRIFTWFIYRFTAPAMRHLFAHPRNYLQLEQAVISMLAGDVFDSRPVLRRLRVFRVVYYITSLRYLPEGVRHWRRKRRESALDVAGETLQPSA